MSRTDSVPPGSVPPSGADGTTAGQDDPRVVAALCEYVAALEAGRRPDRQEFLARHPGVRPDLAAALDGLEFVHAAAPELRSAAPGAAPPADGPPLEPAVPLGDYRIVRELGRGGMGVVYEAVQLSLGRRVALKVLPFAAALDPRQLQRFKNEAQAAAGLNHPHVVPVYGLGTDRGVHYYAMQYVEGFTLAQVIADLRGGAIAPAPGAAPSAATRPAAALSTERSARSPGFVRAVARLGRQAAEALDYAHEMGLVHRDIKPSNLMVDSTGHLWVTDFGLARFRAGPGLTLTGDIVGTLRYASPEQALGKPALVDHRSDVYSLGVTLYELLTLRPAYAAEDREELLRQIAWAEPVPPRRLNTALPAELETVLLKAMAREPEHRYASAADLADDLGRFLEDRPVHARRPTLGQHLAKWARRHRAVVATAAAGLVLAVAALVVGTCLLWRANKRTEEALQQALAKEREAQAQRRRADDNFRRALDGVNQMLWMLDTPRWQRDDPNVQELHKELRARGLAFFEAFIHRDTDDPALRYETAQAYDHMSGVYGVLREYDKALESLGQGAEFYGALAKEFPAEKGYSEAQARNLYEMGIWHNSLARPGYEKAAGEAFRGAFEAYRRLLPGDADGHHHNRLAFRLAECPLPSMRDPAAAIALAREAIARDARLPRHWNTLGAAYHRAGQIPEALAAVEKSMELGKGGDAFDWFLLAMIDWHRGRHQQARRWYDRGVDWMNHNVPTNDDIYRYRYEVDRLLNPRPPAAPKKEPAGAGKT
jgi:serine/threonine protein kinase